MKKLLVIAVTIASLSACNVKDKPKLNYECRDYFTKDEWSLHYNNTEDSIVSASIDKKVLVKSDIFPNAKDSVSFLLNVTKTEFDKLPNQDTLNVMVFDALLKSKYGCKNTATFNPYKIWAGFSTNDENKEEFFIYVNFMASNAYGTPGELTGSFRYDPKTYKMVKEFIF